MGEPEVNHFELDFGVDKWLVMASDGLWEFMDAEALERIVSSSGELDGDATVVCRSLIDSAKSLWAENEGDYRDDITAIVVQLQKMYEHMKGNSAELPDTQRPLTPV